MEENEKAAVEKGTSIRLEPDYNPFWVLEGAPFSVTCISESDKKITVSWTVQGANPKHLGFVVKSDSSTLPNGRYHSSEQISKDEFSLDYTKSMDIMCQTSDPDQDRELFVSANIVTVTKEHPNITEGEDVSLRCIPDMPARVVWSRDAVVITNTTERRVLQDNNKTLVIRNSQPNDSGMYQCTVLLQTTDSEQNIKEQPFVQKIPLSGKPYLRERTTTKLVNDTLSLTCPVAAYPAPEVYWLRADDSPVESSSRVTFSVYNGVQGSTLMISDFTKEDLGVYVCVAENAVGKMVQEFQVGGASSLSHAHVGLLCSFIGLYLARLVMMVE